MSEKKRKPAAEPAPVTKETDAQPDKKKRSRSRLTYIVLYIAAFVFIVYALVSLFGINAQIREKRAELEELKSEIKVQEIKNEDIKKMYNYTEEEFSEYIEQIARDDLDYVRSGERVFVNVSGD